MHVQTPPLEAWFRLHNIFSQCEIFVAASLIIYWSHSLKGSHSLLGGNDFSGVIHFQEPVTSGESYFPGGSHWLLGVSDWGVTHA